MKLTNIVSQTLNKVRLIPAPISITLVSGLLMYLVNYAVKDSSTDFSLKASLSELSAFPLEMPNVKYELLLDTMEVRTTLIKPNQFLVDILKNYELSDNEINNMVAKAAKVFDLTKLRAGKEYSVMCKKMTEKPYYLIYEPDAYGYVKLDFRDTMQASYIQKNIQTNIKIAKGIVNSTLSESMAEGGLSYDLIDKMEDALAYTVDFYHVQKDDKFKVLYEDHSIDGKSVGVGKMYGAYFEQNGKDYYAIYYKKGDREGYYDLEGRPMKRYFLKAPVKFSRISSGFSLRRFHPVLKYNKPHFGTDYAAPAGTPIMSVGNGVVIEASRNGYNGNYVKIKHDATYTTQYLHMSRIGKGIRKGVRVSQGQTIGYVGSTGLATGPHVCFRFWKNGVQCNHLKEKVSSNPVMNKADLPEFFKVRDEVV
ncbi:MAG TPA: peptidoglycan DD-metalloendopeptidase family protein, partial [Saprospiraceae bacterium]|nr:peptidoglycan DD-metalloendopeptidase family protein [Saprospiraceae bacterium]HND16135.1 peptidoglycan DD-metalloendopeptidase family protein [Saprospiraceae bacterium]